MDGAAAYTEIQDLLWEWDFIGVRGARSAGVDEYDCLLDPLYTRTEEASKLIRELIGFIQLADECEKHVLSDRSQVRREIIELAHRVLGELPAGPP